MINLIVAVDSKFGIAKNGDLPWNIPSDMKHFKNITSQVEDVTKQNVVIMGKHTWNSIPRTPLKSRLNVILTEKEYETYSKLENENILVFKDLKTSITALLKRKDIENIFIIGGETLYKQALQESIVSKVYLTRISHDYDCDLFLDGWENGFENEFKYKKVFSNYFHDGSIQVTNYIFTRKMYENRYLTLMNKIVEKNRFKEDRTGTGTYSLFGKQLKFSLENDTIPLLTTKRVYWKGVVEELLWFIRGNTNGKLLQEKNVHIWDKNGSRKFLDNINLQHREEDDLGPVYGFQWRHFGADYQNCHSDYTNQGVDQLHQVVNDLKENPTSRRLIVNAWNASKLQEMALPPCHVMFQFYVQDKDLYCHMYQRSADFFLGVPFNIASYALLTHIIAKMTGLNAKKLIMSFGDVHVYSNHIAQVKLQSSRKGLCFPKLSIKKEVNTLEDVCNCEFGDFELKNYFSHGIIKADMAV